MERDTLIGVDPSLVNFGACIYVPTKNTIKLKTGEFVDMVGWINSNADLNRCVAVVENPGMVSAVFKMWPMVKAVILAFVTYQLTKLRTTLNPAKVTIEDVESKFRIALKYAQSVGENKAAAKIIIQMLQSKNVPVLEISPAKRDNAITALKKANKAKVDWKSLRYPTKMTSEDFNAFTGYKGQSNNHNRDAATLIIGRSIKGVVAEISKIKPYKSDGDHHNEILIKRESERQLEIDFYNTEPDDLENI